jgi:hypothetical protein
LKEVLNFSAHGAADSLLDATRPKKRKIRRIEIPEN